ncbi:MAG: hypothetical protein AAF170_04125 [Bacteroidota bacterium]
MTDSNTPRQPEIKPYQAPELHELGTIGAVTAGPNNGSLDQLGGSSGGFLVAQGTS